MLSESCIWLSETPWTTVHGILQARNTAVGSLSLLPGIEPRSTTLQADSLPTELQGKPKNTAVDSLSLLQQIFPEPEIKLGSPALQVDSLPAELWGKPLVHVEVNIEYLFLQQLPLSSVCNL